MDTPSPSRHPLILLLQALICLYDLITFPFFGLLALFNRALSYFKRGARMVRIRQDDPYSAFVRTDTRFTGHYAFEATTIPELVALSLRHNPPTLRSLGERNVQRCTADLQVELTGYAWYSLAHVDSLIDDLAKAFIKQGVKFQERVLIYSETRSEWFLCAQALFRIGAVLTTLFSTLSESGLIHGINETEVEHIVLTDDLVPGLLKIISQLPSVKYLYVITNKRKHTPEGAVSAEVVAQTTQGRVKLIKYSEMFQIAKTITEAEPFKDRQVVPTDVAVVLYTSGSTGKPKGVIQTHENFITVCHGLYSLFNASIMNNTREHTYYAFLPLAHTFELIAEMVFFGSGIAIGYGTPRTIMDTSPGLVAGQKGDLAVLQPTIMCSVPLVLDRIRTKLMEKLSSSSLKQQLFQFALEYKRCWTGYGFSTPLMNATLCKKTKQVFGGRLQFMIVGGATLSAETQELIQLMFDTNILIGYGMTETCAACFVSDFDEHSLGTTFLLHGCKFRLIDWIEGGYRVTDVPHSRGELVIGGPSVTTGYFKQDELTAESYEIDSSGTRWFKTGDIAEIQAPGVIKIIDRKKDLLKMPNGEFVSVGKVESELKCFPYAEHLAVFGNPQFGYLVALVAPNVESLRALLSGKEAVNFDLEAICKMEAIRDHVLAELKAFCAKVGLSRLETPQRLKLCSDEWTVPNGLLTASMKINRNAIRAHYAAEIKAIFSQ